MSMAQGKVKRITGLSPPTHDDEIENVKNLIFRKENTFRISFNLVDFENILN